MRAKLISFGLIEIEGRRYDHDVVIEAGVVRRRSKKPSKHLQADFGHTPLSAAERIPWSGRRLIVGTGAAGQLPITDEVYEEAVRRGVEVVALATREACQLIADLPDDQVQAILHVTC
jgi:hypothetical protein